MGTQIKIFVGVGAHGVAGAEDITNGWLAKNPHIIVKDIQTALTGGGGVVVTIWYEDGAPS